MQRFSLFLSKGLLTGLVLMFMACNKEKQVLQPQQKPTVTTENAKTILPKTETSTTFGKIVTVAFTSAIDGFDVQFTNSSKILDIKNYAIASYGWDFGDTKTSTDKNPIHTYTALGSYKVTLTVNVVDAVTGAPVDGPFVVTKNINVVAIIPTASFTIAYSEDSLTASFNNSSTNGTTYNWDLGDGTTSTEANPSHPYTAEGTYTVKLAVTSKTGNIANISKNISITYRANFNIGLLSGAPDLFAKQFINKSNIPDVVEHLWDLDNGVGPQVSDGGDAQNVYTKGGNYTVTLTETTKSGTKYTVSKTFSLPLDLIVDFISWNFLTQQIVLTNKSKNAVSHLWVFGDGSTSTEREPTHTYTNPGRYTVSLIETGINGETKNLSKEIIVR